MSIQSHPNIPLWIQNKIVGFFNYAQSVDMILDGSIQDDPVDGHGNTMGTTLAARILAVKNNLPSRRFEDLEEIDAIQGVGVGTIQDLVYSFGQIADAAFKKALYESGTLQENWPIAYFRYTIQDSTLFEQTVNDPNSLRIFVLNKVLAEGQANAVPEVEQEQMLEEVAMAYIDTYSNSTPAAAYALALWFYQFDADNWFSWEQIQAQTIAYFEHNMQTHPWMMDLHLLKGFVNRGILKPGVSAKDLPVVVNWAEQSISFWVSALYD
ncbi:MAG: hypothetical protein AB8E82_09795 [Aureispira sp.]